jgi:hypothetical protein
VRSCITGCLLALVWPGWSQAISAEAPAATQSAAQLRAGLLQRHRSIRSFYIEYRGNDFPVAAGWPPGTYLHRIVAAKAPYYYFHHNSHGHDRLDWSDDPLQQRTYVTGSAYFTQKSICRQYFTGELKPNDPLPGSMPAELFLAATSLWPLDDRPAPRLQGEPYMLCDVSACDAYSRVRPKQELCDGRWCHVLERPGYASLWIDTGRGFALVAREDYNRANGALIERIESLGHREIRPGIWMPIRIHKFKYENDNGAPSDRLRKTSDASVEIQVVRVNDVETALFDYGPPPGAYRLAPEPQGQSVPGGQDLIADLARWVNNQLRANRGVNPAPLTNVNGFDPCYSPIYVAAVLIVLCEYLLRRRRARVATFANPWPKSADSRLAPALMPVADGAAVSDGSSSHGDLAKAPSTAITLSAGCSSNQPTTVHST